MLAKVAQLQVYSLRLALYEMRESRAYKPANGGKYTTFEGYCQGELGFTRRWANKLIEAADFGNYEFPKDGLFSTGESEWATPPQARRPGQGRRDKAQGLCGSHLIGDP